MARLKSEDKRNAILSAATEVFALRGLSAPTASITTHAGVAEGTLFTYFKTKDELINALYREIKLDLADAMMSSFPRRSSIRNRLRHVWDRSLEWGLANPSQHKVLKQIMVWGGLTDESKQAGSAPFLEIETMTREAIAQRIMKDLPQAFVGAAMGVLSETVIDFIRSDPERAEDYKTTGFEMLWAGIAQKK